MQMENSASPPPFHSGFDALRLYQELEHMIEYIEECSVQLTWMSYDVVALRTSPELWASMRAFEDAFHRCTAVVRDKSAPESTASPRTDI